MARAPACGAGLPGTGSAHPRGPSPVRPTAAPAFADRVATGALMRHPGMQPQRGWAGVGPVSGCPSACRVIPEVPRRRVTAAGVCTCGYPRGQDPAPRSPLSPPSPRSPRSARSPRSPRSPHSPHSARSPHSLRRFEQGPGSTPSEACAETDTLFICIVISFCWQKRLEPVEGKLQSLPGPGKRK